MIYEEGDLIKRAMRDLYTRDIEEVLVEGEEGYRSAKRLMTMLMPSRARLVKPYKDETPLFFAYKVEDQLDAMHSPTVQLPSGGSIVIHTTEALTAIDVNSGRSTRERHIDETAVKTNLEAADEVARQLRLRDLAGLIVIDFIDMAEGRHQRAVEKRLRDALKADRARIQMGKISQFGLMELSRQRLRSSLQELSSQVCPHCAGLGVVRSTESCALQALRAIQEAGIRGDAASLRVALPGRCRALSAEPEARGAVAARAALRDARPRSWPTPSWCRRRCGSRSPRSGIRTARARTSTRRRNRWSRSRSRSSPRRRNRKRFRPSGRARQARPLRAAPQDRGAPPAAAAAEEGEEANAPPQTQAAPPSSSPERDRSGPRGDDGARGCGGRTTQGSRTATDERGVPVSRGSTRSKRIAESKRCASRSWSRRLMRWWQSSHRVDQSRRAPVEPPTAAEELPAVESSAELSRAR